MQMMNYLDAVLLSHLDDARIDDGIDVRRVVGALLGVVLAAKPLHDIESFRSVELDWIAIEKVRHHHEVAICSKLVSDQLDVDELVANDVRDAG